MDLEQPLKLAEYVGKRRGISLLETLLAMTLLVLLASLFFSYLIPLLEAGQRATVLSDLRQQTALTLETLAADIEQSAAPGLTLTSSSPGVWLTLSVHQVQASTTDGNTIWSDRVRLYSWDTSRAQVRVLVCPPLPAGVTTRVLQTRPARFSGPDLQVLLHAGLPSRVLCSDVEDFQVVGPSSHGLVNPVRLSLTLRRSAGHSVQRFQLERRVTPAVRYVH